jgi:hypothetical protein
MPTLTLPRSACVLLVFLQLACAAPNGGSADVGAAPTFKISLARGVGSLEGHALAQRSKSGAGKDYCVGDATVEEIQVLSQIIRTGSLLPGTSELYLNGNLKVRALSIEKLYVSIGANQMARDVDGEMYALDLPQFVRALWVSYDLVKGPDCSIEPSWVDGMLN